MEELHFKERNSLPLPTKTHTQRSHTNRMQALQRQRAAHPGQQHLLVHRRAVAEEHKLERRHRQEVKVVHRNLEVLEHLRMRPARYWLLRRTPQHPGGTVFRPQSHILQVAHHIAATPQPHTVLGEQDQLRPGQRIVDDDRPKRVHAPVGHVRRQPAHIVRYHSAVRGRGTVARTLQGVQVRLGQPEIVHQQRLGGQLHSHVLDVQQGGRNVPRQCVRDDGKVGPRARIVQRLGEAELDEILRVDLGPRVAIGFTEIFLQ